MHTIVCSDRDGTINKDENYFLGSKPNWKNQVSFLEGVVEGIKLINTIPDSYFFILTNQAGVALMGEDFKNLTVSRMKEVNEYIFSELESQGVKIDNWFSCHYVNRDYEIKARELGRRVNGLCVKEGHPRIKPSPGMIKDALMSLGFEKGDCEIYMIGDRASDVEMALRMGGVGILVESYKTKELGDREKVEKMKGNTYIAENFLEAAKYIKNHPS